MKPSIWPAATRAPVRPIDERWTDGWTFFEGTAEKLSPTRSFIRVCVIVGRQLGRYMKCRSSLLTFPMEALCFLSIFGTNRLNPFRRVFAPTEWQQRKKCWPALSFAIIAEKHAPLDYCRRGFGSRGIISCAGKNVYIVCFGKQI